MDRYNVIVIGGGPAGMFAAGFAAAAGARVALLEKNANCGAKLLITGKGRCNVSNSESDPRRFAGHFGRNGRALLTALYAFGVNDVVDFFEKRGLELKVERGGRIFPRKGGAGEVNKVLETFVADAGVRIVTSCEVRQLVLDDSRVSAIETSRGSFAADRVIVATGGLSYRETGCTGDGYRWAEKTTHRIIPTQPALEPLQLAEQWTGEVSDFNMKNVKVTALLDGRPIDERFGEAFFTRRGIGGPIVLDMSRRIREALPKGRVTLQLDLKPAVDEALFDKRLQRELAEHSNKDFRKSLGNLLPKAMIPVFIRLSGIEPAKKCHSVTREERLTLLRLFKALELHVTGGEGFSKAIVTSGGVDLKDIDMRTMRSKKVENLFFAGEMIDLDGPTGGFNLQLCWSTGYLAGISAAAEPGL